jgi:hypothetical protein
LKIFRFGFYKYIAPLGLYVFAPLRLCVKPALHAAVSNTIFGCFAAMGPSASRRPGPTTCCRHLAGSSYARKRQGGVLSFDTHAIIRSMRQGNCKGNKRSSRSILGSAAACHRTLGCFSVRSPFSPRHFPASFPLFHSIPTYSKGMPHGRSQTSRYKNRKITKRTHFENDAVLVNQRLTGRPALRSQKNEPILFVITPLRRGLKSHRRRPKTVGKIPTARCPGAPSCTRLSPCHAAASQAQRHFNDRGKSC